MSGRPGIGPPREVWLSRPSLGWPLPSSSCMLLHYPSIPTICVPPMAITSSLCHMPASLCLHIFYAFHLLQCLFLPGTSSICPSRFNSCPSSSPKFPVTAWGSQNPTLWKLLALLASQAPSQGPGRDIKQIVPRVSISLLPLPILHWCGVFVTTEPTLLHYY